ncbi:MAG: hypothetical protein KBD37_08555, partial [Burkholderiales bacterium]|nr:hypothetical protein [Burkholderiales bacterium]
MNKKSIFNLIIWFGICLLCQLANADQNIEIVGGNATGRPKIAVINFENDMQNGFADIIASDLTITGEFNVIKYSSRDMIESSIQYIISGNATDTTLSFQLDSNINNNTKSSTLINKNLGFDPKTPRRAAHMASNAIYKQLTNVPGAFTSKIAYIIKNGKVYSIIASDYDGYNQKILLSAHAPIISLDWDNIGQQITYVTYELNKPVVYVQDLYKA